MHAYFLRAGDVEAPIVYTVERSGNLSVATTANYAVSGVDGRTQRGNYLSPYDTLQGRWEAGFTVGGEMLHDLRPARPFYVDDWADPAPVLAWLRKEKPDVIITPAAAPRSATPNAHIGVGTKPSK
jgi:hypothetical protein